VVKSEADSSEILQASDLQAFSKFILHTSQLPQTLTTTQEEEHSPEQRKPKLAAPLYKFTPELGLDQIQEKSSLDLSRASP